MNKILLVIVALILSATAASADGEALFMKHCKKCHGATGKADTPMGKVLKMRDFTDPANQATVTDEAIKESIINGRKNEKGKKVMLAFGDKLSPEEVDALTAYFRSLQE
jgi:mono/diheme cytochrome c family protein